MMRKRVFPYLWIAALSVQPVVAQEAPPSIEAPAAQPAAPADAPATETPAPTPLPMRTDANGRTIVPAGERAALSPITISPLHTIDADPETGTPTRFLIQQSQLNVFVKSLHIDVTQSDGRSHLDIKGWVPLECVHHLSASLVQESGKYAVRIEGRAARDAQGNVVTPEECFSQHPATRCNMSRNASERNCVSLDDLANVGGTLQADLAGIEATSLTNSGDIVLRTDSHLLDERTGQPQAPTDSAALAHHTSAAELFAEQRRQEVAALCSSAEDGDREAISTLRTVYGMTEAARQYEEQADARELDEILNIQVTDLRSAERKSEALIRFARTNRQARAVVAEALMTLARDVGALEYQAPSDDDSAESDSSSKRRRTRTSSKSRLSQDSQTFFGMQRFNLLENIYKGAERLGVESARMARDQLVIERLEFAAQHAGEIGEDAYARAEEAAYRTVEAATKRAIRESESGIPESERHYTSLYHRGSQLLAPADHYGRSQADYIAARSIQHHNYQRQLQEQQSAQAQRARGLHFYNQMQYQQAPSYSPYVRYYYYR